MTAPVPTAAVTPSQVKHPIRTAIRGLVQWVPPIAVAVPLIVAAVEDGHAGATGAIGLGAVAVATAITRIMAIPQVNDLLANIGLDAGSTLLSVPQLRGMIAELEAADPPGRHEKDDVDG